MGTLQGFLDFKRKDFEYKSIEERLGNYEEFLIMRNDPEIKKQAARCMECETPFCHALGCPVFNRIPEWNDLVFRKDIRAAYESLILTNSFPEFTGRVCPALCESACSLSISLAPVTIKQIELYIIEKAFEQGYVKPDPPAERKKGKVAVVGSGPSGLSAAQTLNRMGYQVTVYEKYGEAGGIMRFGIPNFKLPKWVLDRRTDLMEKEGIVFRTNAAIGRDFSFDSLKNNYDATLLCIGAGTPRDLPVTGRDLSGIHFALDYLKQSNEFVSGKKKENEIISAKGKKVLVIGGGDTGSDCIGTANRQGAEKVTQVEILPRPEEWTKSYNPAWPDYPNILRTSSSHLEGCIRDFSVSARQFISRDGRVAGAECVRLKWEKDANNNNISKEIPGSSFLIEADMVILAMGFLHAEHSPWLSEIGIEYDRRGNISTSNYHTNIDGLFAAGDASTGASLVCRGIYHGRQAAKAIDEFLT
ncbi:MAG TPA: glutamate synthase subunit beta [Anaerovoracaceae bacterium]|nr:glutamate synthase subunit beta [Anaerovoracaceae bacterium]